MSVAADLETELRRAMPGAAVTVGGDGYRWEIDVVSPTFEGMSRVKRQQAVYAAIGALIKSGAVHAVTIVARTPSEERNGKARSDG
jgi:acid stress-induced BolA-like protein IbaG/YrbA